MAAVTLLDSTSFQVVDLVSLSLKDRASVLQRVCKIERKTFPSSEALDFDSELRKKNSTMLLALEDGNPTEVCGYLVFVRMKKVALLHKVCVVESKRRQGVAKISWLLIFRRAEMAAHRLLAMRLPILMLLAPVLALSPQVNFPLSAQYPPVARVGEPFFFQFASSTFQSESGRLQYSLTGNPSWLSLHGENRTLHGTSRSKDVGEFAFSLTTAGEAGAVATLESKLLVTDVEAPAVKGNISEYLAEADSESQYHATLMDHTPLPTWISFDSDSLRFAGTTPSVDSPQIFDILLIALEKPNYAMASIHFSLVVSHHQLVFKPLEEKIIVPKGDEAKDIKKATADIPAWLEFDEDTLEVSGKPPSNMTSQEISITVEDVFGDVARYSILLITKSRVFGKEVGTLQITAGQRFEYTIPEAVLLDADANVSVDFGPLSQWLSFDSKARMISGTLPEDTDAQEVEAIITASASDGAVNESQMVPVVVSSAAAKHPEEGAAEGSLSLGDSDNKQQHHRKPEPGVIAGAVIGALLGSSILAAFAVILCRRKRKSKSYLSPRSPRTPRSPRKADISRPILLQDDWKTVDESMKPDLEKGDGDDTPTKVTPERPPQIKLDLAVDREISTSPVSSLGEGDSKILSSFHESPWGFNDQAGQSHRPHDSMKIPTAMARQKSETSETPSKRPRPITTIYRDPQAPTGLPVNRRLSGLGHGRRTSGSRRRSSYNSYSTISTSILSTVPSVHNRQHLGARHTTQLTTSLDKRCSIRVVSRNISSACTSLAEHRTVEEWRRSRYRRSTHDDVPDRRPIDERRQSYIRKRASAQSPFFGASSSRVSSASYESPLAARAEDETPSKPTPSPLARTRLATSDEDESLIVGRNILGSLRIRKPSDTPSVESSPTTFPGSLRKPPTPRKFTARHTVLPTTVTTRDRVSKRYQRLDTSRSSSPASRRSSVRAQALKSSLNSLTGTQIFEDAEMSSAYSTEDEEIAEYEKRTTIKPSYFPLPPLDVDRVRTSKVEGRAGAKQHDAKGKGLKKASQREPTPFLFSKEHGGKENEPYRMDHPPPVPPIEPATKPARTHVRSQSTAFPHFSAATLSTLPNPFTTAKSSSKDASQSSRTENNTAASLIRDLDGNVLNYALHEDPTIEELASKSIGLGASNGRIKSQVRRSRLVQQVSLSQDTESTSTRKSAAEQGNRKTVIQTYTPTRGDNTAGVGLGLNFSLLDDESRRAEEEGGHGERRGGSWLKLRNEAEEETKGKGKGMGEELWNRERKERSTWGSLKSKVLRREVDGSARGFWEGRDEGIRAFI
ncbi:hypothetical protein M011DRAFT_481730 [Sporormia fimetaria CBS 119925]|uniref:Dystroglycan-type cadherin-like domain-containing protein n=1 Tax=Sporormia fimetaria CBS 119925 TaxID=1340428 RepID=A0A6A6UYG2_9PLEO|nr:hypothetical protein M011DRAFT_481730 [Sporormia fimetaria CBS 119925]